MVPTRTADPRTPAVLGNSGTRDANVQLAGGDRDGEKPDENAHEQR
jgi:hypothetical protein